METQITQQVNTSKTRVKGAFFDFGKEDKDGNEIRKKCSITSIAFGNEEDGEFSEIKCETWVLSGQFYTDSIGVQCEGNTIAEALLTRIAGVVSQIQTTEGLKQELIESGELNIINCEVLRFIQGIM